MPDSPTRLYAPEGKDPILSSTVTLVPRHSAGHIETLHNILLNGYINLEGSQRSTCPMLFPVSHMLRGDHIPPP